MAIGWHLIITLPIQDITTGSYKDSSGVSHETRCIPSYKQVARVTMNLGTHPIEEYFGKDERKIRAVFGPFRLHPKDKEFVLKYTPKIKEIGHELDFCKYNYFIEQISS